MAKLRDLLADLKQTVAAGEVALKIRLGDLDQGQRNMSVRLEDLNAQVTRMEHDLAIIKEYLVTRMRSSDNE